MTFSKKRKNNFFPEKVDFFENVEFFKKTKKLLFENFDFFKIFRKIFFIEKINIFGNFYFWFFNIFRKILFIEKIKVFGKIWLFILLSYLMDYPQQVASRNSHCAACGRDKRPGRKPENPENSKFWRFLGALFPYKSYRIFIKICDSKKFNRFFFIENKKFFEKTHFLLFNHISSPISENFITQLLRYRALEKLVSFFPLGR